MTSRERADLVREYWEIDGSPDGGVVDEYLPSGSVVLTPDEVEKLNGCLMAIEADDRHPAARMAMRLLGGAQ